MKHHGPPLGSGPRSERSLRVVEQRSLSQSDAGRASPPSRSSSSPSKPTAATTLLASTALNVVLRARGRSRFDASFGGTQIVKSSIQPLCNAARILHSLGYSDDRWLIAWHEGSNDHAISGELGYLRKRRVREDRGLRYVAWEPHPRRVGSKKGPERFEGIRPRAKKKNVSASIPGAARGVSTTIPHRRARPVEGQL